MTQRNYGAPRYRASNSRVFTGATPRAYSSKGQYTSRQYKPVSTERYGVRPPVSVEYRRDAWDDLASGYHRSALDSFGILASESRSDALPKIGYALAAAGLNDDQLAATALRRAMRADASGVFGFLAGKEIGQQLRDLEKRYRRAVRKNEYDTDAVFLLAAVRTLRGTQIVLSGDLQMLSSDDRALLGFGTNGSDSMYAR